MKKTDAQSTGADKVLATYLDPIRRAVDTQKLAIKEVEAQIARLVIEALKEGMVANKLHHVVDGEEAMRFLRREDPYADAPRPGIVLLDLNLPKKSGREVLAEVKVDPALMSIPIVVLTTSAADQDVVESYEHHANAYVTKPLKYEEFLATVRALEQFWLTIVRLP